MRKINEDFDGQANDRGDDGIPNRQFDSINPQLQNEISKENDSYVNDEGLSPVSRNKNKFSTGKGETNPSQNVERMNDEKKPRSGTSRRGFASMNPEEVKEIASRGGKAAHQSGNAHEFTSAEARKAARERWG